jgi:hypothetical protein
MTADADRLSQTFKDLEFDVHRYSSLNKMQGGDPDKFPKFIMDLTELEVLPSRIYVGSDALRTIARRLGEISQSVDEHRDMSSSTDFDV